MKRAIFLMGAIGIFSITSMGQKYFTRSGHLGFFSKTSMEDIKADNESVTYIIDLASGEINISALQTNFQFAKALMQEHYNENYMESSKFPKATFKGKIVDLSKVNFKKDGTYPCQISGDLNLHGVSKNYKVEATFKVSGNKITAESKFFVKCADHGIKIEPAYKNNISENIEVKAKAEMVELKK